MDEKTYGTFVCEGRDPEEGDWIFDDGGYKVNGETMAYEIHNREDAINAGVSEEIMDLFEKKASLQKIGPEEPKTIYDNAGLFYWLQENHTLFR